MARRRLGPKAPRYGTRSAPGGGVPGNFQQETLPNDASRTMHNCGLTCRGGPARAEQSEMHKHHTMVTISACVDQCENKKEIRRSFSPIARPAPAVWSQPRATIWNWLVASRPGDDLRHQTGFCVRSLHFLSGCSLIPSSRFIALSTSALRMSDFIRSGNGWDPISTARYSR